MLLIPAHNHFNLHRTMYSHGWCSLPPFRVTEDGRGLCRVMRLKSGKLVAVEVRQEGNGTLGIRHDKKSGFLDKDEITEITTQVTDCLRMNEDFSSFYREARKHPGYRWIPKTGAGRLLRSPTVFEDLVKMICTTNCSWALTEIMTVNLCRTYGERIETGEWAFPVPAAIAQSAEKKLRKDIHAGYRSPYILELARRVADGKIDPEKWRSDGFTTDRLYSEVTSVKGIGPYAAGNILKLLGHYDYLGIDSWCRKQFSGIFHHGRKVSDKTIVKRYAPFGRYRGLFFWLDMTKHWYGKQFPF